MKKEGSRKAAGRKERKKERKSFNVMYLGSMKAVPIFVICAVSRYRVLTLNGKRHEIQAVEDKPVKRCTRTH